MDVIQNYFVACENHLAMKYIIPEKTFDMTDIWSYNYIDLHIRFWKISRGGGGKSLYTSKNQKLTIFKKRKS